MSLTDGGPCTVGIMSRVGPVQWGPMPRGFQGQGQDQNQEGLHSEVQCIMANGHMVPLRME